MSNITQIKMPNNSVPYDIHDAHALRKYHDLEINWEKQTDFIPPQGEIIVYDIETLANGLVMPNVVTDQSGNSLLSSGRTTPYTYERFKIGDGIKLVGDLPFAAYSTKDLEEITLKPGISALACKDSNNFVEEEIDREDPPLNGITQENGQWEFPLEDYERIFWQDGITELNAENLNKMDYYLRHLKRFCSYMNVMSLALDSNDRVFTGWLEDMSNYMSHHNQEYDLDWFDAPVKIEEGDLWTYIAVNRDSISKLLTSLGNPDVSQTTAGASNAWAWIAANRDIINQISGILTNTNNSVNNIYNSLGYPNEGQSNAWAWINANRDLIGQLQNQIGDVESLLAEL